MGLTRIRAEQISDIDYKQSVRVITLTNITLAGGAPAEVDGVSLAAGNRILVNGQSDATQNGLYQVQTLGTGSNGTWVRTSDANQDGEIQSGMVVMVTEGVVYADTPWKLVTNGDIIIGTTELVFQENYSLAFGNIYANGTAVIANTVSGAVTFTAGDNISIVGNNTSKTVTIGVTGITTSRIANGTSNVDIATEDGNVTTTVNGNTTLTVTGTEANIAGDVRASGDISGGNLATSGQIDATGNITGGNLSGTNIVGTLTTAAQTNITSVGTLDSLSVTGNIQGNNIQGNNIFGNGSGLSGIDSFGNVDANGTPILADSVGDALTLIPGDNISIVGNNTSKTVTIGVTGISLTSIANGTSNVDIATADGNVTAAVNGNVILTVADTGADIVGDVSATGNVTGGNITTAGDVTTDTVTATGNVTGSYFIGNGSQLTGISTSTDRIFSGDSNVEIASANADITMSVAGTSNVVVVSTDGITVQGNVVGNGIPTTTVSSTPPADAEQGDIWIDSDTAIQYIYFGDGNSSQWAEMEAATSISTGSGDVDLSAVAQDIIPSANATYSLGNATNRWANLFLVGNTIDLGGAQIKVNDSTGAFALIPAVTAETPNPVATVITASGGITKVETDGGNISESNIANVATNASEAIMFFSTQITANLTVPGNTNALSAGPITIVDGVEVTVSEGSEWTVV